VIRSDRVPGLAFDPQGATERKRARDPGEAQTEEDMKRFKVLLGQRRFQVLGTMAVLLLAASVVYASGASFTASAANPSNVFTAGSLHITDNTVTDGNATVVWSTDLANPMKPGETRTGDVTIKNSGTTSGKFTLVAATTGTSVPFQKTLRCSIVEDSTPLLTNVPLDSFASSYALISGASWAGGITHVYHISVTWGAPPAPTIDNDLMNASATVSFTWSAISD
jgi:spore coat-associated protein N